MEWSHEMVTWDCHMEWVTWDGHMEWSHGMVTWECHIGWSHGIVPWDGSILLVCTLADRRLLDVYTFKLGLCCVVRQLGQNQFLSMRQG